MSIAEDTQIHAEAIEELGASFGADIEPVVMEVEGRTVELKGSVEEQYREWRRLLREIFAAETGFSPDAESGGEPLPEQLPASP